MIERGWICSGGTPNNPDSCTQKCGDGLVPLPRPSPDYCDDGNNKDGDGCTKDCKVEPFYTCFGGTDKTRDKCVEICGDGIDLQTYGCDDGNLVDGDGCNKYCRVEFGYTCSGGSKTGPDTCTDKCGDGFVVQRPRLDYCDDGDRASGDGCSSTCCIEDGWQCSGGSPTSKDECSEICGDGKDLGFLECDDGNNVSGDGCSADCEIEFGWICEGGTKNTPDICTDKCGDGFVWFRPNDKYCDDGDNGNSDGCSANCQVEPGFECSGGSPYSKDVCKEICGDGKNMGFNECDDGNTVDGDGCSSTCEIEEGFTCTGGNEKCKDTCVEKCGDGLNFGQF